MRAASVSRRRARRSRASSWSVFPPEQRLVYSLRGEVRREGLTMISGRHGLSLALVLAACGGSQDKGTTSPTEMVPAEEAPPAEPAEAPTQPTSEHSAQPPPAPATRKLTTEELVKAHDACYAAFLARDEK